MQQPLQQYQNFFDISAQLGPASFGIVECEVQVSAYGQLSTGKIVSSLSGITGGGLIAQPPVDLPALTNPQGQGGTLVPMTIGYSTSTGGGGNVMFGGNYMHGLYSLHDDKVELWGRDYAGVLFDTKVSLASLQGGYQGLTVNQFVTNIANQFGLTPNVTSVQGNTAMVGDLVNLQQAGTVMSTVPKSLWDFLVYLARWVGASIYTDPLMNLNFVDQTANPTPRNYMFAGTLNDVQGSNCLPVHQLQYLHQPQRNSNFSVCVISHNAKSCQILAQTVFVAGQAIQLTSTKSKPAGIFTGSDGRRLQSVMSTRGLGIPVYYLRLPEHSADQAQFKAQGLALDIASRFLVATLVVDIDFSVIPLQQINIQGGSQDQTGNLYGFANRTLYVSSVKHSLAVPQSGGIGTQGGWTVIKALSVPPAPAALDGSDIASLVGGT